MTALLILLALSAAAEEQPPRPARVVTLADAERLARERLPALRQARAAAGASQARADEARSGLLPQLNGSAQYQKSTSNFAPRPGSLPSTVGPSEAASWSTSDYFGLGITASQLVWDFGQTGNKWRAAQETSEADAQTARFSEQQAVLSARTAFFQARAARDLVRVARATVDNQQAHLQQIRGFVDLGTRPPIDLAQARTNLANAQVQLVNAENGYDTARARLNQSMGVEGAIDYEVSNETLPPVEGEDAATDALLEEAVRHRPDVAAADRRILAAERSVSAAEGAYGPSIGVSTGFTDAGTKANDLVWNWNATATLTWPIFSGGLTQAQVSEARANEEGSRAANDQIRQQVRFEVEQARLSVRAARTALSAAGDAVTNGRELLRLAEGRYRTGSGSALELSDAQVATSNAEAQQVQAEYNLSIARAQLLQALGRR